MRVLIKALHPRISDWECLPQAQTSPTQGRREETSACGLHPWIHRNESELSSFMNE